MTIDTLDGSRINAFPVSPTVPVPVALLQSLQDSLQALQDEVVELRGQVSDLEARQDDHYERLDREIGYDRQRIKKLESIPSATALPRGEKSVARIAKLRDFLKARGGGATFQECERLLGIRPNQMTKLVSQLDKRSFEVFTRAGDDRQRVIRLKAQIVQMKGERF